jgi:hypothetical protein
MVVISYISFAVNNNFIFNRSDAVSAIGAFAVACRVTGERLLTSIRISEVLYHLHGDGRWCAVSSSGSCFILSEVMAARIIHEGKQPNASPT